MPSARATLVALIVFALASAVTAVPAQSTKSGAAFHVVEQHYKLANGLKVVLSPDATVPTAVIAVYYNIGFRNEPRERTGFAHLFEHLMFQGSRNLGKLQFIRLVEENGGILNGSTRFDFTNYFQVVPSNAVRRILWAEADRMKGLAIDTANVSNQRDVVKNEVRVNVLNQPYGGFPWIDLPVHANTNWYNAHNFYGDMGDLDAANLADAASFFHSYYAPNNAVLVVTGDIDMAATKQWIEEYFSKIPSATLPPKPDLTEPKQTAEKRFTRVDSLATRPAIGLAYHVPERFTPEWYAFGLLDQLLAQGRDSRFYQELVQKRALTGDVSAGINYGLGNQFDYQGPMLWEIQAFHDGDKKGEDLLAGFDAAIEPLRTTAVDQATLDRALVKMRSSLYSQMEQFAGFGRANLLASFALFDDDPERINQLERGFAQVTPAILLHTAQEYLRPTNRTIEFIVPAAKPDSSRSSGDSR
ncbi:MAG TPA: pitrilysin family protein [Gemmatimonadaceae bacterium]|nr:pitrilysin family protein [Gemmatimonadaceae bacterium]